MHADGTIDGKAAPRVAARVAAQVAGGGLLHPAALAAIAVLVLNDHVLKQAWPGFVTGKLSDVAGMVFFPLFLQGACEIAHACARPASWRPSRRVLIAAALATAVVFAAVKLSPLAGEVYRTGLGLLQWPWRASAAALAGEALPAVTRVALVQDAGDLIALPFVLLALRIGWPRTALPALSPSSPPSIPENTHENAFAS